MWSRCRFARSAAIGLVASIYLFGTCSTSVGVDAFDAEAHLFYGAESDPRVASNLLSYLSMSFNEWSFILLTEPTWMLGVVAVILWGTNTLSISTIRRAAHEFRSSGRLAAAWRWTIGCVGLGIVGTAILPAALMLRPYLIVLPYHNYQAATAAFWFWSVVPGVLLLPLLMLLALSCIGTVQGLKCAARFLRSRRRDSQKWR